MTQDPSPENFTFVCRVLFVFLTHAGDKELRANYEPMCRCSAELKLVDLSQENKRIQKDGT